MELKVLMFLFKGDIVKNISLRPQKLKLKLSNEVYSLKQLNLIKL